MSVVLRAVSLGLPPQVPLDTRSLLSHPQLLTHSRWGGARGPLRLGNPCSLHGGCQYDGRCPHHPTTCIRVSVAIHAAAQVSGAGYPLGCTCSFGLCLRLLVQVRFSRPVPTWAPERLRARTSPHPGVRIPGVRLLASPV